MKNLKRVLSLALSTVMLMGMMVVGTSAANYSDVTSEHNEEAIEIMQAVGVMVGDGKGFNPDQKVTRNEMAVVMANLLDLKVEDYAGTNPFTDVPAWAAPFVAACKANGIVSGTSATTFNGEDTVTAAQAGLMMMKALGYFQYQNDFGDDWQLATVKQASKIDLYKDIEAGANTALTRNAVAQLALNTLKADVVDFTGEIGSDITTSDGTAISIGYRSEYSTLGAGTKNYNFAATGTDAQERLQLAEKLYGNDLRVTGSAEDSFGRPANRWTYKAKEVGVYAKDATLTYTDIVKASKIYSDLGLSSNHVAAVTVDGVVADSAFVVAKNSGTKTDSILVGGQKDVGVGTTVEVYYDIDADTVEICAYNTFVGVVTNVYPEATVPYITIGGITGATGDYEITGYEVDDIVLYTHDGNVITSVAPATKVGNLEVTSFTTNKVTAGGTTYTYNNFFVDDTAIVLESAYDLYLDKNGYVVYTELYVGADNYAYVLDTTSTPSGITEDVWTVKMVLADGSVVTAKTDNAVVDGDPKYNWVSYSVDKGIYTLYARTTDDTDMAGDKALIVNGQAAMTINDNGVGDPEIYYANENTVFVIHETGTNSYKTYTGIKNVPSIYTGAKAEVAVADAAVQYNTVSKVAGFVYVETASANIVNETAGVIYVAKASKSQRTTDSNGQYYVYNAVVDGEITTIKVSTTYTGNNFVNGELTVADAKLGNLTYNSKGLVNGTSLYSLGTGEATITGISTDRYKNGTIGLGGGRFTAAEDAVIYTVDGDGKIALTSFTAVGTDTNDTYYGVTKNGQIKTLFITKVGVATPVVTASISGSTITVNVSNNAATMTMSYSVTGQATVTETDMNVTDGTGVLNLTPNDSTGYVTIKVTNTVPGVGSAFAEYVVAY